MYYKESIGDNMAKMNISPLTEEDINEFLRDIEIEDHLHYLHELTMQETIRDILASYDEYKANHAE
jgi:replicative superfamily II helicase